MVLLHPVACSESLPQHSCQSSEASAAAMSSLHDMVGLEAGQHGHPHFNRQAESFNEAAGYMLKPHNDLAKSHEGTL